MKDYSDLGLNNRMQRNSSMLNKRNYVSDYQQDTYWEQGPFAPGVQVSKGTVQVTAGGIVDFQDEGGTSVFTYNALTRAITITGNVDLNGTLTTDSLSGTINPSVGTVNNLSAGTVSATYGTLASFDAATGTISGNARIENTLQVDVVEMIDNSGNYIYEYYGLCLRLADKAGVNSIRIQNSDNGDMLQFQSKGGIRFVEQSTPSSPDKGLLFFDTADAKLKIYNGGAWGTLQYET